MLKKSHPVNDKRNLPINKSQHLPSPGPTTPKERIHEIDILRGFALLGIFMVNMFLFSSEYMPRTEIWPSTPNIVVLRIAEFFFWGKFWRIYSMLFGLGFIMLFERFQKKKKSFHRIYTRRLLVLFVIGCVHLCIWEGDILLFYAIYGFSLLLIRNLSAKKVLTIAIISVGLPILMDAVESGISHFSPAAQTGEPAQMENETETKEKEKIKDEIRAAILREGKFRKITRQNWQALWDEIRTLDYYQDIVRAIGLFLLGVYAGKRHLLVNANKHRRMFRRLFQWGLILGIPAMTGSFLFEELWNFPPLLSFEKSTFTTDVATSLFWQVGTLSLCLSYIGGLMLLLQNKTWKRLFFPLAAAGRIPLTNYLCQTLISVSIFYGYGLGMFGQLNPVEWTILLIIIYAVQIFFSNLWVKRFNYGPAEWLWRVLTYGSIPRMRIAAQRTSG